MVSPIAETTTTTSFPAFFVSTILCATRLTLAASETDEPPNFCTIKATCYSFSLRYVSCARPRAYYGSSNLNTGIRHTIAFVSVPSRLSSPEGAV